MQFDCWVKIPLWGPITSSAYLFLKQLEIKVEPFAVFTALTALAIASSNCGNAAAGHCLTPSPASAATAVAPAPQPAHRVVSGACSTQVQVVNTVPACGSCSTCGVCSIEPRYLLAVTRPGACNDYPVTYRVQVPEADPRVRSVDRFIYR